LKATANEQHSLLQLAAHEFELAKINSMIRAIESGVELEALRTEARDASEAFLQAQNEVDNLGVEIERLATDLALVETRLSRDKERLRTLGSPREAAAVESEIASLEARKSSLETAELELLETRSEVELRITDTSSQRAELAKRINDLEAQLGVEIAKLKATGSTIEQQIRQVRSAIGEELLNAFDRKSTRALAVGKVTEQSCGACRLMLTPTAYSTILSAPADELATCPNCDAFLVR
jgi:predicted  nucleic acid-binding Zn-ribbon protein